MIALLLLQTTVAGPMLPQEKVRVTAPACRERAAEAPASDILVCAQPQASYRLQRVPERYDADAAALPKAETGILGGKAKVAAETEQAGVSGFTSNRAMIRLKVPF